MKIMLPGVGRSVDSIIKEACKKLDCEPWGGQSGNGWSRHLDFQRCPYRYYLKHIRGVGPVMVGDGSPALDIGACCHLLLASRYSAMLPDCRYPGWRPHPPDPTVLLRGLEAAGLPLTIGRDVEQLYDGYAEKYSAETIVPVAVEFEVGIRSFHTSRYDLVFFAEDGIHDGLWIGEHKTMSSSKDIDDFQLDGEVLGEMLSWQLSDLDTFFGAPLNGVCINALIKPSSKGLPRYQRKWIPFSRALVEEFTHSREALQELESVYRERDFWPKQFFGCLSNHRRCRFWEHCRAQDESMLVQLAPRGF